MAKEVVKKSEKSRVHCVDVLRGLAMVLIIFAHCRPLINEAAISKLSWILLYYCTNISTVTFTFINGTMLTYFFISGKNWNAVYAKFAKRALLLLACHPLIKIISYPAKSDEGSFLHYFFVDFPITDTIALCLLLTPLISRLVPPGKRLLLIISMLVISPSMVGLVQTGSRPLEILIQFLFGSLSWNNQEVIFPFPLIPWLAIDLCGSFVGEKLARNRHGQLTDENFKNHLFRQAMKLLMVSALLVVIYKIIKITFSLADHPGLQEAISPSNTTMLLPAYIAVIMLALRYLFKKLDVEKKTYIFAWMATVFGRTSLFTYNIEFIIAMTIPTLLGLKHMLLVPGFFVAFAISVTLCWFCSYYYGLRRGWLAPYLR